MQGEGCAPQHLAGSTLCRDPVAQPAQCSTRPAADAASQLGVFADCSSDDDGDFELGLLDVDKHSKDPYRPYGFQSAGEIMRQTDPVPAVSLSGRPRHLPADRKQVAHSTSLHESWEGPSGTAALDANLQVTRESHTVRYAAATDSMQGQASCNVVFADSDEAGRPWTPAVVMKSSRDHVQPGASHHTDLDDQDREFERAAPAQAAEQSKQGPARSPVRHAAWEPEALLMPDWEQGASMGLEPAYGTACASDDLPADFGVSCKGRWPATASPGHQRVTSLLAQRVVTGQKSLFAGSIVFADEHADLEDGAGSHACQAADATHSASTGGHTTGHMYPDTGWADESAENAPSSAFGVALTDAAEHRMHDAKEDTQGIIFADSPEDPCPASPVTFADQPGNDSGHDAPDLSIVPVLAGITPLQGVSCIDRHPRQQTKRKCTAEDLRDKMIKVCYPKKNPEALVPPLCRLLTGMTCSSWLRMLRKACLLALLMYPWLPQELLEGKGRSCTLEPLVRCMQSELDRSQLDAPDQDVEGPRLSRLQEACHSLGIEGAEAPPQVRPAASSKLSSDILSYHCCCCLMRLCAVCRGTSSLC